MVAVNGDGTYPVQGGKIPGQRTTHRADVNEARCSAMAEIGSGKVEEVDDDEQLGEPEVAAHPEMHEAEEEEVVGDEVAADVCGSGGEDSIGCVECVRVVELEDEENDPG